MNIAHLHLLLNHVPIIGTVFGVILLSIALMRRSEELKKISLGIFVVAAAVAFPVYFTGEPAEEIVEHLPGVSESVIEDHEEAAEISFAAVELLGAIALAGLVFFRGSNGIPHWLTTLSLVLAVVVAGLMAWTANRGGQIRHTEISAEKQSTPPTGAEREKDEEGAHEDWQSFFSRPLAYGGQTMEFTIPRPLKMEHDELHAELTKATKAGDKIGEAAAAVAKLLHPHFVKEEAYALPPLGLLPSLAAGTVTPEMARVLPMTDKTKAELPQMLAEHTAIVAALKHLADVAKAEGQMEYVHFAEKLIVHAQTEEQVLYPATIMIGEYLRLKLHR